jgi:hypothetical protein
MLDAGVQRFSNRKSPRICHYPAVGCLPGDYYQLPWLNMPSQSTRNVQSGDLMIWPPIIL